MAFYLVNFRGLGSYSISFAVIFTQGRLGLEKEFKKIALCEYSKHMNFSKDKKLEIQYFKGKDFDSSLSTGVYGGFSLSGHICMNFFVDRVPIPDKVEMKQDGENLGEGKYVGNESLGVREMIKCIMMDAEAARNFHQWLGTKLKEYDSIIANSKK